MIGRGANGAIVQRLLLVALAAGVLAEVAVSAVSRPTRRDAMVFSLVQASAVRSLAATVADPARARLQTLQVSDAMLEVIAPDGDVAQSLAAGDGVRRAGSRGLFRFRLLAVVAGHIRPDAGGWCSPWRRDESWCEVDCDGGGFMLRRPAGGAGGGLELTIHGPLRQTGAEATRADDTHSGAGNGISLTACRLDTEGDLRLMPADGLDRARLPLVER